MDQTRLIVAIAVSIAILLGFQYLVAPHLEQPPPPVLAHVAAGHAAAPTAPGTPAVAAQGAETAVPKNVPRVQIASSSVHGAISLLGARVDELSLNDYRQTLAPNSPQVELLAPLSSAVPYYIQYGWVAAPGAHIAVPDNDTVWQSSAGTLSPGHPVTLSWNNGQGLTFRLLFSIDEDYMLGVTQQVNNASGQAVTLYPWARIRRDYTPGNEGLTTLYGGVSEGLTGVAKGTLHSMTYATAKSRGKKADGIAYNVTASGGWAGITDKYWLTALVPNQSLPTRLTFRYYDQGNGQYQVGYIAQDPTTVAPGATVSLPWHAFAGAKLLTLLDRYESQYHIPSFGKAVDFGWFYLLAKPIFYCLDWLNSLLGNFGLAIIAFTTCVKLLFFPLANYSYRSMGKMRLLAPRVQALRERLKDEPQKMQQEMMALYRAEKVNPASGCLPMIVQIPVFISLYVVIFTTIEMRQAPFFGWIHDLSQPDPTNIFNLFGLLPFDPTTLSPYLHLGVLPLVMGGTMFLQQKLNPPPPDPVQARLFQFMPVIFTFMLARFPAGLVIYWTWNNLMSVAQQWVILRRTRLSRPGLART